MISLGGPKSVGHVIGFKIIQDQNKMVYHFCDFNRGEFFTDDLQAFKSWFEKYYLLLNYHKTYSCYDIYSMNTLKKAYVESRDINIPISCHFNTPVERIILHITPLETSSRRIVMEYHDNPDAPKGLLWLKSLQNARLNLSFQLQDESPRADMLKCLKLNTNNAEKAFILPLNCRISMRWQIRFVKHDAVE